MKILLLTTVSLLTCQHWGYLQIWGYIHDYYRLYSWFCGLKSFPR